MKPRILKRLQDMSPSDIIHSNNTYHSLLESASKLEGWEFEIWEDSHRKGYHIRLRSRPPQLELVK
jgi:hypothetical protein